MVATLGRLILVLALAAAVYNVGMTGWAYRVREPKRAAVLASAHNAALAVWGLLSVACLTLIYLFLTNDFAVNYVWGHSSIAQPFIYKVSALWGGQAGSLLLWAWMLATYGLALALFARRSRNEIAPTAVAVLTGVSVFFISLIVFVANPFAPVIGDVPSEGIGLNPLLQNYWMQIHPPTLYAGYVGCTVPFAFAAAALLHGRFDNDWVELVRRWTLLPWIILTCGIIMGGAWAYETLGWGGYWAWDPVENASLMPWLTATAFLHSIMIQGRRGMLKNWNMVLVSLTFLLSIFGTFLTRSGVVSSVHSFAESNIGGFFLGFLAFALVFSFGLILWRRDDLASRAEFDSVFSREGAFLLNNWILLCAAFAVLWGTIFPAISEALAGQTVSVGAPYFNRVMVPLGLLILALTGIGPLMAWRRSSLRSLLRTLRIPLLAGLAAVPVLYALSKWHTGAATAFCLAVFVTVAIGSEFVRGARARSAMTGESFGRGLGNLLLKNKRRYGGYIVHLGIALMFCGFAGSSAFKIETEPITLRPGETMQVGEYTLRFDGLRAPEKLSAEKEKEIAAAVTVLHNGRQVTKEPLHPHIDFFKAVGPTDPKARAGQPPQQARRPAIMSNLANDLYLVLDTFDEQSGAAAIKAYLNPLVMWIWISVAFFIGGTVLAMIPDRRREPRRSEATATTPARKPAPARAPAPQIAAATAGEES